MSSLDFGFNYRNTAGYVTDQAFCAPVLGEAYPHTYTNGNGQTINAGWTAAISGQIDRDNTLDARLAGSNYVVDNTTPVTFKIDLSSGSGNGAGTYILAAAFGDASFTNDQWAEIKDGSTVLIEVNVGPVNIITTLAAHYLDATVVDRTAAAWPGSNATSTKVFATTTCNITCGANISDTNATTLAHFRLTSPAAPATGGVVWDSNPLDHYWVHL